MSIVRNSSSPLTHGAECVLCKHTMWTWSTFAHHYRRRPVREVIMIDSTTTTALPPIADAPDWRRQLDELRIREKAATRELDAIAAQRRRLPMVQLPDYVLEGES